MSDNIRVTSALRSNIHTSLCDPNLTLEQAFNQVVKECNESPCFRKLPMVLQKQYNEAKGTTGRLMGFRINGIEYKKDQFLHEVPKNQLIQLEPVYEALSIHINQNICDVNASETIYNDQSIDTPDSPEFASKNPSKGTHKDQSSIFTGTIVIAIIMIIFFFIYIIVGPFRNIGKIGKAKKSSIW